MPLFVRPARRPRAPSEAQTGRPTVRFEVSGVNNHCHLLAVIGRESLRHLCEDTLSAPTVMKRLVQAASLGASRQREPMRLMKITPFKTQSAHPSARIDQTFSSLMFRDMNHPVRWKSLYPKPKIISGCPLA